MKKAWEIIKAIFSWIGRKINWFVKWTFAAELTVIGLGAWLVYTQAKTIGIIVIAAGILFLINEIYENMKEA